MGKKIFWYLLSMMFLFIIIWLIGKFESDLIAQKKQRSIRYKKKTIMSFDDKYIEGEGTSPFGSIILTRKTKRDQGLIKIRKHWRKEIVRSANLITN